MSFIEKKQSEANAAARDSIGQAYKKAGLIVHRVSSNGDCGPLSVAALVMQAAESVRKPGHSKVFDEIVRAAAIKLLKKVELTVEAAATELLGYKQNLQDLVKPIRALLQTEIGILVVSAANAAACKGSQANANTIMVPGLTEEDLAMRPWLKYEEVELTMELILQDYEAGVDMRGGDKDDTLHLRWKADPWAVARTIASFYEGDGIFICKEHLSMLLAALGFRKAVLFVSSNGHISQVQNKGITGNFSFTTCQPFRSVFPLLSDPQLLSNKNVWEAADVIAENDYQGAIEHVNSNHFNALLRKCEE